VRNGAQLRQRFSPNPLGRRVRDDPIRKASLELLKAAKELVVGTIRDFRAPQDMVEMVVVAKLGAKASEFVVDREVVEEVTHDPYLRPPTWPMEGAPPGT